jgi:hypothetical protein
MALLYTHRQFSRSMFFTGIAVGLVVGAGFAFGARSAVLAGSGATVWIVGLVGGLFVCALVLIFAWMHVRVTDASVSWAFGPGFPNYRVAIGDVTRCEPTGVGAAFGAGLRITPKGRLYTVGGPDAVVVATASRTVLIGTDDPAGLASAIASARDAQAHSR